MQFHDPPPHLRPENHELARAFVEREDAAEILRLGARLRVAWPDIFCLRLDAELPTEVRQEQFRKCLGHYIGQLAKREGLVVLDLSARVRFASPFKRGVRYGIPAPSSSRRGQPRSAEG